MKIRGRRGADLLRFVGGVLRFVVVRGALPRDPEAHACRAAELISAGICWRTTSVIPAALKTAGIIIPAPAFLLAGIGLTSQLCIWSSGTPRFFGATGCFVGRVWPECWCPVNTQRTAEQAAQTKEQGSAQAGVPVSVQLEEPPIQ